MGMNLGQMSKLRVKNAIQQLQLDKESDETSMQDILPIAHQGATNRYSGSCLVADKELLLPIKTLELQFENISRS